MAGVVTPDSHVADRTPSAEREPILAAGVTSWDATADVIVLGFGCAGAAAAIGAAATGGEVLIVERSGGPGGAATQSGGWMYLGGGTAVQKGCGVVDNVEEMRRFLAVALGPEADHQKIDDYAAGSVAHFDWLADLGVRFGRNLVDRRLRTPGPDDGLSWMGEDSVPFIEHAVPAPRAHRPGGSGMQGAAFMAPLEHAATASSSVLFDAAARRLVVGGDGRVVGVVVRRYGTDLRLRARCGVVVTTGGFVYDDAMLASHVPELLGHTKVGSGGDDGSGIELARAAGAALRQMGTGQVAPALAPGLLARSIVVNLDGKRFVNEDTYPGRVGQFALFHHGARAFVIFDEETVAAIPEGERRGQRPDVVAADVDELAAALGVPPGTLDETIRTYNEAAARGEDAALRKDARWLRCIRAPYGALDLHRGTTAPAGVVTGPTRLNVFTLGGLWTDRHGVVLAPDGSPVPGLYAAGRAASGLHGWGYITGTSLGDGTFFGRRAGRAAASSRV